MRSNRFRELLRAYNELRYRPHVPEAIMPMRLAWKRV